MKTCSKTKTLDDVHLEWEEAGKRYTFRYSTLEERARYYEETAERINEAVRGVKLLVRREYVDVCDSCGRQWEPVPSEDGHIRCAGCGAIVEE